MPGPATQRQLLAAVADPAGREPEGPEFWRDIQYFTRSDPYIACSCGRCGGFPAEPSERLMRLADAVRRRAKAFLAENPGRKLDVKILQIVSPTWEREFCMVRDPAAYQSPAAARFWDFVLAQTGRQSNPLKA